MKDSFYTSAESASKMVRLNANVATTANHSVLSITNNKVLSTIPPEKILRVSNEETESLSTACHHTCDGGVFTT